MHLFKRQDAIPVLLERLDIPQFVYPHERCESIGPNSPEFFIEYAKWRKDKEQLAIAVLEDATDEELWELCETPGALDLFELENSLFDPPSWYDGGFGVAGREADFSYWVKMDFWTIEEATCLSIGFTPEKIPERDPEIPVPKSAVTFYHDRVNLFKRAKFASGGASDKVHPREFVDWALKKGIEIPDELVRAINESIQINRPAMLGTVDARKYDSAMKVILGLISNEYGFRGGAVEKDIKSATVEGLESLGLNIDRKTLSRIFSDAVKSLDRLILDQEKRDK